ncbi:3-phosphoshikimate 1-carboxyvinyltransferase [Synechococcus sp. A18-25c]|uniref:3-phosphoshikimate 1-carboxyvinyltransferase n=1 Tax=unclassified Synechococcus TaxID=2626047 RepID=UPI000C3FB618|nr:MULTISPECIES: 3-phosphoshikimate 1-carboxyvinyltransferase [unclassified Synechococcus]MAN20415.1 3-phosphoshikimate 1-carboxyvinyltransferase [Synechococcus sp. EAC657]MEC7247887.1 3-phosphoshikimate 1-carboxyvinyltransferase [Cyanobacteriota bacterium]MEC7897904.1 3-phosphoshikimate 1-carboxyvinyltransferase [Cyanobacteriota bacterium]QNI48686.1 3-phosphoshikimate 1-carboxyvinyltransferase [Synechococcus sp. A15-60]QNJ20311.1 3-phosphoshikimate 1-carboxyvinyltransferase [Synechococcus sp.
MPGTTEEARPLQSGGSLSGHVRVPGDKSISHRALLFGAIAEGQTTIEGLLPAEDPISTAACLRAMGVTISPINDRETITVQGVGLDGLQEPSEVLDCGNSGTTMRLMLGLLAGRDGRHFVLSGDASLRRRPMQRVGQPLSMLGAEVRGRGGGNFAPLAVAGRKLRGAIVGTPVASAQVKSALLLAALTADGSTTVIEPAHSRDHSERMLKAFGADLQVGGEMGRHITVRPGATLTGQHVVVPGDISSAAFWLVAGALVPGADLTVENVGLNPTRTGVLEVLQQMGARIEVLNQRDVAGEPVGDLRVTHGPLKPFAFGEEIMPRLVDEVPILSVAACFCDGESRITGASELRVKETDRLAVMARQLKAMGADIDEHDDGLTIRGGRPLRGASLDSETDHRVAMSLAVAALMAEGNSTLMRSDAAAVSYPTFWDDLNRLHH